MYALPKVLKYIKNPPGRPINSGNGSISEGISQVIDHHLRPHVLKLASYIKDTIHLLLDNMEVPDSAILVTIDVESLHNNSNTSIMRDAINRILKQKSTTEWKFNKFIVSMLEFIWKHSVFLFGDSHFLQVQGVAMGTKCANFLDLQILVDADGTLCSSLYRKPSSGNTILHASSAHPQPLLDSIPYNQFL